MKKVLALALGMLLIPFTAFGMEAMDDDSMDSITGQSGVAISLDNIQLYTNDGGSELWYETKVSDGSGGENAAAVGLVYGESPSYLFINKIANPAGLGDDDGGLYGDDVGAATGNALLRGDYGALASGTDLTAGIENKGPRQAASVLSIRVAQTNTDGVFGGILADDEGTAGAYVEIGLPTLEIYAAEGSEDKMNIYVLNEAAYDTDSPVGSGSNAFSLGTIYTTDSGSTTAILGGRLGITTLGQVPQENTSSGLQDDLTEGSAWQ